MLMFLNKKMRNRKGYTLTELIVVVAILGVLAAVATPIISGQLNDAREKVDIANAKTIENIVKRYVAETGDTDVTGAEAYDEVIGDLGEIPETQQGSNYGFYVKYDGTKVECAEDAPDDDYEEIKK